MLVFNYGSNLNLTQWKRRCPSAKLVGVGYVKGQRLTFVGYSAGWSGATATIEHAKGAKVFGAVYELRDPWDVSRLDRCEGYPHVYGCVEVKVRVYVSEKRQKTREVKAWAYVRQGEHGWPSNDYAGRIAVGLKQHGFSTDHLAAALAALPPVKPTADRKTIKLSTALPRRPEPKRHAAPLTFAKAPKGTGWATKVESDSEWAKAYGDWRRDILADVDEDAGMPPRRTKVKTIVVEMCGGRGCDTELTDGCAHCTIEYGTGAQVWHCPRCCPHSWTSTMGETGTGSTV
jgi:hypothetical protein